jgi:nucleotide-binding universal stress UspA family protein
MMNKILGQVTTNEAIAATSNLNIRRIVVPVDLSAHSENTAAYAVALAKTFGASITFVHVFPPEPITEITTQDFHEIYDRERDSKREELTSFADKIRLSYPHCDTEFRIGHAAEKFTLLH